MEIILAITLLAVIFVIVRKMYGVTKPKVINKEEVFVRKSSLTFKTKYDDLSSNDDPQLDNHLKSEKNNQARPTVGRDKSPSKIPPSMRDKVDILLNRVLPIKKRIAYFCESTNRHYIVNLEDFSCNCWEFDVYRKNASNTDVRRYCRHLLQLLDSNQTGEDNIVSKNDYTAFAMKHYISIKKSFPSRMEIYFPEIDGNKCLIIQNLNSGWFDVFTRRQTSRSEQICAGEIQRYGYNPVANRWAWGAAPFNPLAIKQDIRQLELPQVKQIDKDEAPYEDILNEFIKIPDDLPIVIDSISGIESSLDEEKNPNTINGVLERLRRIENVDQEVLRKLERKFRNFVNQSLNPASKG